MCWNWSEPKPEKFPLSRIPIYYEYWKYRYWILISWTQSIGKKKKSCFILLPCWSLIALIWKGGSVRLYKALDSLCYQWIWLMLWGLTKITCLLGRSYCCQIFPFIMQQHWNWCIIALEVEGFKHLVTSSFSLPDHMLSLYWFLIRMFDTVYSFYSI